MEQHIEPYGYLKGEPRDAAADRHPQSCTSCNQDIEETRSVLSLLHELPEIEPAPEVWTRIEQEIARPRRVQPARRWAPLAAAAAVLVAVASFLLYPRSTGPELAATVSQVSPGSPLVPGTNIQVGETFHTPTFATLTLPGTGTLKLNRNTTLRFDSRRRVTLLEGELFAEVNRGFEVQTGDTTVTVQGTKFGVKANQAVYVLEGRVLVRGPQGQISLSDNEASDLRPERIRHETVQAYLRWLQSMESPTLTLKLRSKSAKVEPGKPIELELVFTSDAPILLDNLRSYDNLLLLLVDGKFSVNLDPTRLSTNGDLLLDVHKEVVLTYRVEPGIFQEPGRHAVSAVFILRDLRLQSVESEPITIEVRM